MKPSKLLSHPAVASWLVARAIVLGAYAMSRFLVEDLGARSATGRAASGLFGWDASWYLRIASDGYAELPTEALRFFPLLPILGRGLGIVLGPRVAILLVVNAAALASAVLLYRLALHETRDRGLAARACWLIALLPPAFVLVMGYAESLFLTAAIAAVYCLRTRRWAWAAVAGFAGGIARPVGILLAVPALISVLPADPLRNPQRSRWQNGIARASAVLAPVAGAGAYLVWVGARFGDAVLPLRLQEDGARRGALRDPISPLVDAFGDLARGDLVGSGLHGVWGIGFLLLLVVTFRQWPLAYGAFAAAVLIVALGAQNLDSLERYGLAAFPLVLALAGVTRVPVIERSTIALSAAGLAVYATLAFVGAYVP